MEHESSVHLVAHGTRWAYQRGCPCLACRAANARYSVDRRRRILEGRPLPGRVIQGHYASQLVRSLLADGYSYKRVAAAIGISTSTVWSHTQSAPIRLSTAARVRRFWRSQQLPFEDEQAC